LRRAEFGFFGVVVKTRTHTPRFWGDSWSAGLAVFDLSLVRPLRINWLTVGKLRSLLMEQGLRSLPEEGSKSIQPEKKDGFAPWGQRCADSRVSASTTVFASAPVTMRHGSKAPEAAFCMTPAPTTRTTELYWR